MALVFQYGSNMSSKRLNSADRLMGDAKPICIARTRDNFDLMFTVWSETNNCAAADLVPNKDGINIYGVIYEIPDYLLSRDSAKIRTRKSLDEIEGEGKNYIRTSIDLIKPDEIKLTAITYLVKSSNASLQTALSYAQHILAGLKEHSIPDEYCQYVQAQIIKNNSELGRLLGSDENRFA